MTLGDMIRCIEVNDPGIQEIGMESRIVAVERDENGSLRVATDRFPNCFQGARFFELINLGKP